MTDTIKELNRLLSYCRHCDETGCLEWVGGMGGKRGETPIFHFSGSRENRKCMAAYRAHWIFAGKQLRNGERIFRRCGNHRCVAIEHLGAGSTKQMWSTIKKDGRFKGDPKRQLAGMNNSAAQRVPEERVRQIEAKFRSGALQKDVIAEFGISRDTARKIKRGQHFHSTARTRVIRGASVFTLGVAT